MSFAVGADAYDRFMGRYSAPLAPAFAEFAAVIDGLRALDVGCGPGALTAELVKRLGPSAVAAVDPSDTFVAAAQARYPAVDVRRATAEQLPFDDRVFDATFAQLVVHFMDDPVVGFREMARVTREEGVVAACVWDHDGGEGPLSLFWDAAHELDRDCEGESRLAGAREGHLAELFREARLHTIEEAALSITVEHSTFEAWWEPFTFGVAPPAATSQDSTQPGESSSANDAAPCCRRHRLRSPPEPGRHEVSPDPTVPLEGRLLAYASVDPLAQQVGVTHVAGVLLDHSDQHLAQRHRPSTAAMLIQGIVAGDVETGRLGHEPRRRSPPPHAMRPTPPQPPGGREQRRRNHRHGRCRSRTAGARPVPPSSPGTSPRSISARCRTSPRSDIVDGSTERRAMASASRPEHFISNVRR